MKNLAYAPGVLLVSPQNTSEEKAFRSIRPRHPCPTPHKMIIDLTNAGESFREFISVQPTLQSFGKVIHIVYLK